MELIPENLDGTVVFNVVNSCSAGKGACINCSDFAVAIHNWLIGTPVRYVIVDLQDEKEVCETFLEELLQLRKRIRYPFLFAGVMDKPRRILESYDYLSKTRLYITPEDAIVDLEHMHPGITKISLEGLEFGTPIATSRQKSGFFAAEDGMGEADIAD